MRIYSHDQALACEAVKTVSQAHLSIRECAVSLASKIEVLGYHKLTAADKAHFEQAFTILRIYPITDSIAGTAIALRQYRKTSLGDALVAATALEIKCPLATHNTGDFLWITGLEVVDPLVG